MNDSRLRRLMLSLLVSLLMSTLSIGQGVDFKGHGIRQHILKSADKFSKRAIAYDPADVSLILDDNSVLLIERYAINDADTLLFEIKNEVFKETAFHFDLIDAENPTRELKGQLIPQQGEFIIMFYDISIAIIYLNLRWEKTSSEQKLDNKSAWENRGLVQ